MGAGGDASDIAPRTFRKTRMGKVKEDLTCLKSMWFDKVKGNDHAARLESFYGPQAHAYDKFRSSFLWGRKPMLAACAARLAEQNDLIWVDLGGGTGENVDMMSEYLPLDKFKSVYVIDLCKSLCDQARKKVVAKGWSNVFVVEGDACAFTPPEGTATLVTFSYSLSMIPPFNSAVDKAIAYLDPVDGLLGVADFFVSGKHDLPMRQMSPFRRFFWRAIFDTDNIDIGPERRNYLDHRLSRVWEMNGQGSIPYVPYLRAPYYVWVGRVPQIATVLAENRVEAPAMFPPTFLYTTSWEDPRPDMEVLNVKERDTVLTLTSGGCNALNLLLHGAGHVVAVDCNPAQSALLELKATAIRQLPYEDVWKMFGEGQHPNIRALYESKLAPFLTQATSNFWDSRLWYFDKGLYYQGGQGAVVYYTQVILRVLGLSSTVERLVSADTLQEQTEIWDSLWFVRFFRFGPSLLVSLITSFLSLFIFNRFTMWFGGGIPCKQYRLIYRDGLRISDYAARTFDGVARNSHLRTDNYFYYSCLTGRFTHNNCPSYLQEANFQALKAGAIDNLTIVTSTFMEQLSARTFTKGMFAFQIAGVSAMIKDDWHPTVILMDHVDWLDVHAARKLAKALAKHVSPGGRVIWRSAALRPPYTRLIQQAGFKVKCLQRADEEFMDRVNMYSSFYVATRQ